mmetsp:Transcript_8442/g.15927  ORF Transcript_8442/g.15927 Transcript_8442/m.15927 type:complete len:315 (-) Transcript_8442:142-1086(-)|eukprot:CAMPEP_0176492514 /NCGR_PEP_ID=MMETSP0200_2-20121128/9044_1 /TAXON_ID=947934 /ORGANISM="Chaetoceros sp., Strain GSL56" /LENGTH=314 /DNA_ID=CAMNT_0017890091 /DNA_START=127 /DNA_END=1071 /DNA_ORIENTATION=+
MKNLLFAKLQFSTLFLYVISLILATCALGASAFSAALVSKTCFRYYSDGERFGIRVSVIPRNAQVDSVSSTSSLSSSSVGATSKSLHQLYLYKDSSSRKADGLHPFYSSVASSAWSSNTLKSDATNKYASIKERKRLSPVRKILHGVTNAFGVAVDVVTESIAKSPLKIKKQVMHSHNDEQKQVITLVDIHWLKAHEDVVSEERVKKLYEATIGWNAYRLPLLVDSKSGAILDGHHRYAVGRVLGLSRLPAILVDYLNDDSISVDVWPECGVDCLTKEDVIQMSLSDGVFPPKTSKHDFVSSFAPINVPLSNLR